MSIIDCILWIGEAVVIVLVSLFCGYVIGYSLGRISKGGKK